MCFLDFFFFTLVVLLLPAWNNKVVFDFSLIFGGITVLSWGYLQIFNSGDITKPKLVDFFKFLHMADPHLLCPTCQIIKTPRSHHCNICNQCVERYDHHSVLINKCIAAKNHQVYLIFIASLLSTFITTIVGAIEGVQYIKTIPEKRIPRDTNNMLYVLP